MKKKFDPRTIPFDFKSLKYDELVETNKYLNGLMNRVYPAWLDEQAKEYNRRKEKREKLRLKELELEPKIKSWLESNLKVGMGLKFKGASRKGIRIAQQASLSNDLVVCQIPSAHQTTTNHFMNLTHVHVNGKWVKIQDLI